MRSILALLLLATTSHAQWIRDGAWFDRIPDPLPRGNGFASFGPTEAEFLATGARRATQEEIDARAAEAQAAAARAEIDRQLNKPLALKKAENNFFSMCYVLFSSMEKRGFSDITTALDAMKITDPQTAMVLSIQLLGIDAEAKREGGLQWWDDAVYHPEIVE